VHKNILAGGALDEPITLCSVKPLHNALLFHGRLLSPRVCVGVPHITSENAKSCRRRRRRAAHCFPRFIAEQHNQKHQKRPSKSVLPADPYWRPAFSCYGRKRS
jgi:hypothetical protein